MSAHSEPAIMKRASATAAWDAKPRAPKASANNVKKALARRATRRVICSAPKSWDNVPGYAEFPIVHRTRHRAFCDGAKNGPHNVRCRILLLTEESFRTELRFRLGVVRMCRHRADLRVRRGKHHARLGNYIPDRRSCGGGLRIRRHRRHRCWDRKADLFRGGRAVRDLSRDRSPARTQPDGLDQTRRTKTRRPLPVRGRRFLGSAAHALRSPRDGGFSARSHPDPLASKRFNALSVGIPSASRISGISLLCPWRIACATG